MRAMDEGTEAERKDAMGNLAVLARHGQIASEDAREVTGCLVRASETKAARVPAAHVLLPPGDQELLPPRIPMAIHFFRDFKQLLLVHHFGALMVALCWLLSQAALFVCFNTLSQFSAVPHTPLT